MKAPLICHIWRDSIRLRMPEDIYSAVARVKHLYIGRGPMSSPEAYWLVLLADDTAVFLGLLSQM